MVVFVLVFAAILWILPIWAGQRVGAPKGRAGWAWGLLLGWMGVGIVALLSNKNVEHYYALAPEQQLQRQRQQLAELEAYVQSEELHRRRTELRS